MRKSIFLQFVLNFVDRLLSPKTENEGWANFLALAVLPTIFFFVLGFSFIPANGVYCIGDAIAAGIFIGGLTSIVVYPVELLLAYLIKFVAEAFFSAYIIVEEDRKKRELENDIAIQNHTKIDLS